MLTNPIQYTSRTFNTIMADINSDPSLIDKPDWFKRLIAGLGDVLSVIENASANQAFLRTAFTRRAVWDLCNLIGYVPSGRQPSSGILMFDLLPAASPPFTVTAPNLAAITPNTISATSRRFEGRVSLSVVASTEVTASTAWVIADDKVTVASVFTTGEKVRLAFSATPPTTIPQVAVATDYFAIYVDATHIRLATSRANAIAGTYINITAQGTGNHTFTRLSRSATCYQQTSVSGSQIGTSDGLEKWQEFPIADLGLISSTLAITLNSITWTRVDTFVNSLASDKHYRVITQTDETSIIQFGDGTYGEIPGAFPVLASYSYGGGVDSNIGTANQITSYAGLDANINGVFNPSTFLGGVDIEPLDTSKIVAPMLLKARDRFVTVEDGVALTLAYGGVYSVAIYANIYGVLSCQVVAIANGGGNPGSTLRTDIAAYLKSRSILASMDVHFDVATITAKNVTGTIHILPGYTWASVLAYSELACKLFFSETGAQVLAAYRSGGVVTAVTLINSLFSSAFGAADYPQIIALLDNYTPRVFGETITISDFYAYVQDRVAGIDNITVTVPTFPIALASIEITTIGTIGLTQV